MERVDSSERLCDQLPSMPDYSADRAGDLAGQLQGLEDDEAINAAIRIVGGVTPVSSAKKCRVGMGDNFEVVSGQIIENTNDHNKTDKSAKESVVNSEDKLQEEWDKNEEKEKGNEGDGPHSTAATASDSIAVT